MAVLIHIEHDSHFGEMAIENILVFPILIE
jgi:hypothetical protein